MGEAIKGSFYQYLQGLKDSGYGIVYIYQLDKKVKDQNRRKRQRIQDEINSRRQRGRFDVRRPIHPGTSRLNDQSLPVKTEPRLLGRVALSATMSSFIWISIWGFNTFLLPLIRYYAQNLLPGSPAVETVEKTRKVWENTEFVLQFIFSSLWVLPLYIISKIVNGFWFVDVSNSVYQLYHGRPRAFPTVGKMIADFIYGLVIETVFLLQAMLVKHIPVMQELTYIMFCIHHSLLYALYAFEYKWFNMGLDVRLRIQMVETHWPYFCGFGTPLFVLTSVTYSFYPTVISACVFSILFPFFIISATKAGTPRETPAVRLRIFELSMSLCNTLFKTSVKARNNAEADNNSQYYLSNQQQR
ncbi:etoposide-induced protein 2.4 homolog [Styela clava]